MKKILIALAVAALLTGCATTKGLQLSPEDEKECAEVGCTAWSERQLEGFAKHFYGLGVRAGVQRGRGAI